MKYTQKLVDEIWDDSVDGLSRPEIASKRKLKWSQINYVLKHKRPSQIFDYHHEDTSPEKVIIEDTYTVDSNGDVKIETPEGNVVKWVVKFFKDLFK